MVFKDSEKTPQKSRRVAPSPLYATHTSCIPRVSTAYRLVLCSVIIMIQTVKKIFIILHRILQKGLYKLIRICHLGSVKKAI